MSKELLSGLLVIDLSEGVCGAYCCKLLADCGAAVIKVERPGSGDPSRAEGPFPDDIPHPEKSALFLYLNAGKKSVTLDIGQASGARLLRRLTELADALVENLPPGRLESLGLGYQELSRPNPRLVMTSISPFGSWGPYASQEPREQPREGDDHQTEYLAGLNAFAATLVGLVGVAVSERGQHIEVAGRECLAAASLLVDVSRSDAPPPSVGDLRGLAEVEHPLVGRLAHPRAPFRTSIGVAQAVRAPLLGEHNEEVLCGLLGLPQQELSQLRDAGVI